MDTKGNKMIKQLQVSCEEICKIERDSYSSYNITVEMLNVNNDFIVDIEAEEIVKFQDVDKILEAIGVEEVAAWLKEKGSL